MLLCHAPEQLVNIPLSLALFRGSERREATEQSRCSADVFSSSGELQETIVVFHDSPLYIEGHGPCAPLLSVVALDLLFKLGAFLLHLALCLVELSLPGLQLL